ncbi:FecR family protein [Tenacibaculum litopenaei]|jgi:ferric-dicitrate binding protein FerR (iron transport regulator)|uniref:FecR family protein n=1 Tax=Tenacibaculum litopenaei TaxID=396016 RepID=UPI0038B6A371
MTKKTYNSIHDFLNDDSFKNWAFNSQLSDVSFWDFWLKNNPLKRDIAYEARDILLGINFKKDTVGEEKLQVEWTKLEAKLKTVQKKEAKKKKGIFQNPSIMKFAVAASILLAISFGVLTYTGLNNALVTHETAFGETLNIKLPDGTEVALNSNSEITYHKNDVRNIWMKGEAFFKVNKLPSKEAKFFVNTKDLTVEVYGTEFNVNTRREKTKVYLDEGNIWLTLNNGNSKKMFPGDYIEYSSDEKKILIDKHIVSKEQHLSWTQGTLLFNNLTLHQALEKISDTYGVNFDFKVPTSKDIRITGAVPTSNLTICLNAIKKSANINIKKENGKLVVYKN